MRKALMLLVLLSLVVPATLADKNIAREGYVPGVVTTHENILGRSDYLVVSVTAGVFTDLGPAYVTALGGADLVYDPYGTLGSAIPGHTLVCVNTTDNWWGDGWNVAADEAALMAFLDATGKLIFVGQDYIYFRGSYTGFPQTYMGVTGVIEDLAANDASLGWTGTAGGPLAGLSEPVIAACFASNGFYTDQVFPASQGIAMWSSPSQPSPVEGGSVVTKAIFSTVEFGCGYILGDVTAGMLCHLFGTTPTEDASWGQIKDLYR